MFLPVVVLLLVTAAVSADPGVHVQDPEMRKFLESYDGSERPHPEEVCKLPKETGPCRAYFSRWYYNSESGHCEQFVYGGCQGNANNFETVSACSSACGNAKGGPLEVKAGLHISELWFDLKQRTMYVQTFLRMMWRDPRLDSLTSKKKSASKWMRLDPHAWTQLWTPDIFFENALRVSAVEAAHEHVLLLGEKSGRVFLGRSLNVDFRCPDIKRALARRQKFGCHIVLESYSYDTHDLQLSWLEHPVDVSPTLPSHIDLGCVLDDKIIYHDCSRTYYGMTVSCLEVELIFNPLPI